MEDWRARAVKRPEGLASLSAWTSASLDDVPRWFFAQADGVVLGADLVTGQRFFEARVPFSAQVEGDGSWAALAASDDGRFVAVAQRHGTQGVVFDVSTGAVVLDLTRGEYHAERSAFPLRFLDGHRLIHGVEWNQLAVTDVHTGARVSPPAEQWEVDYFFGSLELSPGKTKLASSGWAWHPVGFIATLDLGEWLAGAAEPSVVLTADSEFWDLPVCWLDEERFVAAVVRGANHAALVLSTPGADEPLLEGPADVGFELVRRGDELISLGSQTVAMSPRLEPRATSDLRSVGWHPGTQEALCFEGPRGDGAWRLLSRPSPRPVPDEVRRLAVATSAAPAFEARQVLADALDGLALLPDVSRHLREARHDEARCYAVDDLAASR